ncbi:anti-sigma factor [Aquincola sp. MAHUQ-54]|uniref:Anti-sigma factor n=1 Tax=Aquincola agrisoli TaxID=3119538 RepID=A0AAW9QI76_9BURK
MTASSPRPDDTVLGAWLDGELDAAEHARVIAWMAEHPEDASRVQAWAADRDALRGHFAGVADEPVPAALARTVWRRPQRAAWARAAMAAGLFAAGALAGGGTVWWGRGEGAAGIAQMQAAPAPWVQRAALAHGVYVPERRHPVEVRAQEEHLARWLTRRTTIPVKLFDLRDQGFELIGGRLLPDGASPSAQLMYQDDAGQRVTVYLRKPDADTPAAFRYERQGALGLFYWVEAGAGYALAGTLPRERLLSLAEAIHRQQPAPTAGTPASTPGQ